MNPTAFDSCEFVRRGRLSTVYRAIRAGDRTPVIIKTLNGAEPLARDLERLRHELQLAQSLDASGVVRAYELTTFEGRPALMMEDFGGGSIEQLPLPLSLKDFFPLAIAICDAVAQLHARGVLHRDLKPHNIIFSPLTGTLKLTDLGIASRIVTEQQVVPASGTMQGTPAYLSPEQTGRVSGGVDFRSDLYSLGVTFFQLLTGVLPFEAEDALEWVHCHIARRPRVPVEVRPDLPPPLSELILKLLAKSPDSRYQTALGLKEDLTHCRERWTQTGRIPPFALAANDTSDRFQIPQRLYGRGRETAELLQAFEHAVTSGHPEVMQVSGYSGIGKSSLVQELYGPIVLKRGFFISGKFDQYKRHIPYATISQALRALVQQMLTHDEDQLSVWRATLQQSVAPHGGVVTAIVPEFEQLLGPQPPVAPLGPAESQNRFSLVFQNLIAALAQPERPIALFLDDMQWADGATLSLLETLLSPGQSASLLVVCAYRDNEVDASHPYVEMIERLRHQKVAVHSLHLTPLDSSSVTALLADALHALPALTEPLAQLVIRKTQGNPFFVAEFVKTLHREGLLHFDVTSRAWVWNQPEIDAKDITDNVVEMMIDRLRRLPQTTQGALELAAYIGNRFELSVLALVSESAHGECLSALVPALEAGLLAALPEEATDGERSFRFQHDRIQQAAYTLVAEASRARLHLRIGRMMRSALDAPALEARLFDVVNQLNSGAAWVTDAQERNELLQLNLRAGRKARASTAYGPAQRYLSQARALLPSDAWSTQHTLAFTLHAELAECEYLGGNLSSAEQLFREAIQRAHSELERATIYGLQMRLYQVAGRYDEATEVAIRSFRALGLEVPLDDASAGAAVGEEAARALALRGSRPILELLDSPRLNHPEIEALLGLLEASGPPLYMVRPALFPWIALKMVNLSLEHGNTEASCYGYGIYAILLSAAYGDVEAGYAFSQLAIQLNERFNNAKLRGAMLHLLGDHVNFWKNPIATGLPILQQGFQRCVEGGDLIYSNYIGFQSPWHLLESGARLDDVYRLTEPYDTFAKRTHHHPVHLTLRLEQRFIRGLQGTHVDLEGFDAVQALAEIKTAKFGCGIVYFYILEMISAYLRGDAEEAWRAGREAEKELGSAFSMPIEVSYYFYRALAAAACAETAAPAERVVFLDWLAMAEGKMATWTQSCPDNFADKRALLAAERARLHADPAMAMRGYEQGIAAAREQGFIHLEALGNELAGRFYEGMGVVSVGALHLRQARALYLTWGAAAKAHQLEKTIPGPTEGVTFNASLASTEGTGNDALDLLSVVKLSQAISSKMVQADLLEMLMKIVVQYAAAERGYLILLLADELSVAAKVDINQPEKVEVAATSTLDIESQALPLSIIHHVRRTGERVLLANAGTQNAFSSDRYLMTRRPRSVLCLPVLLHSQLTGMFYLENNLISGAFGPERLTVLELLATQVGISMENSRLFRDAQDAIRLRDQFLSIASHELKTPLTPLKMHLHTLTRALDTGSLAAMARPAVSRMIQSVDRQVGRLTSLIEDLLDVTRIATGKLTLHREPFDLAELVREVAGNYSEPVAVAKCQVSISAQNPIVGHWDRLRMEQVVVNLLTNALKYSPGKPVHLSVDHRDDHAVLTVRDEGIGIAKTDHQRIFGRYERVHSTSNVTGIGLGLFLVKAIVEAHGGEITVESIPAKGSTFAVNLPLDS